MNPGDVIRAPGWCAPHQPRASIGKLVCLLGSTNSIPVFGPNIYFGGASANLKSWPCLSGILFPPSRLANVRSRDIFSLPTRLTTVVRNTIDKTGRLWVETSGAGEYCPRLTRRRPAKAPLPRPGCCNSSSCCGAWPSRIYFAACQRKNRIG